MAVLLLPRPHETKGSSYLEDTRAEEREFPGGKYIKMEVAPQLNLRINGPTDDNGYSSVTGMFGFKHLVLRSRCCRLGGSVLYNFFPRHFCGANECLSRKSKIDLLMAFIGTFDNGIHEQCHELLAQN